MTRRRAAAGLAGLVLIALGLALPGRPPKTSDTRAVLVELVTQHHAALRLGTWAAALGAAMLIGFLGLLYQSLADDDTAAAATALIGGGVAVVLLLTGMAMTTGLSLVQPAPAPDVTAAAIGIGNVIIDLSKFGFAVLIASACCANSRLVPARACFVGRVVAACLVLSALSPLASDRAAFQFGGPFDVLGSVPATLWLVWLTCHMLRSSQIQ